MFRVFKAFKRDKEVKDKNENISVQQLKYLRSVRMNKILINLTRLIILLSFFAIWELFAELKIIDPFITSQPSRIWNTLVSLSKQGELLYHVYVTCYETLAGFIIGTTLGTIIAIILWLSNFISKVLEPYLVVLNSLPKIALGPIFIVWIGAGPAAIITVALTISLVVTILEVYNGFNEVDRDKIRLIEAFGAGRFTILNKVVLPASFPTIINTLKVNVGLSWVGVIVGEFLVSKAGLGYLIVYGGQVFKLDLVMASVIILAVAAAIMYLGVLCIQKKIMKSSRFSE